MSKRPISLYTWPSHYCMLLGAPRNQVWLNENTIATSRSFRYHPYHLLNQNKIKNKKP